jgi:hypothetical protein
VTPDAVGPTKVPSVEIRCPKCLQPITVDGGLSGYRCVHCMCRVRIRRCGVCRGPEQTFRVRSFQCSVCAHKTKFPLLFGTGPARATSADYYAAALERGLYKERSEEEKWKVDIACAHCNRRVILEGWEELYVCPHCKKRACIRICDVCSAPDQSKALQVGRIWTCHWCRSHNRVTAENQERFGSVATYRRERERRDLPVHDRYRESPRPPRPRRIRRPKTPAEIQKERVAIATLDLLSACLRSGRKKSRRRR